MTGYIIKRLIAMVVTLWFIITLTFFLMHSIPGSPFNEERNTSEAVQRNMEKFYHLDEPLYVQYGMYLKSVATFDFGPSIKKSSQTVNEMLGRGFPVSFELGIVTLIVAVFSGIALGIIAALRHNGFIDYLAMTIAVLGISVPNFVLATLLIQQL
ncbi:ABC transporter permease, partial [Diaphorobacter sp. DS2]